MHWGSNESRTEWKRNQILNEEEDSVDHFATESEYFCDIFKDFMN